MRVWGIGALWGECDMTEEFINNNYVKIGYEIKDAPDLYEMLNEIKENDIVYIKSFVPKNRELHIKAVGIVSKVSLNSKEIYVHWFADLRKSLLKISLNDFKVKNNVYSNTLYREYNNGIIQYILERLTKE